MDIKTTASLEIPVHQKLTVGINKMQKAATFSLWVLSLMTSSNILQEAIAVRNAKNMCASKVRFKCN